MANNSRGKRRLSEDLQTCSSNNYEQFKINLLSDLSKIQDKLDNKHLNEQSKMIIRNVYRYFQCEKEVGSTLIDHERAKDRCIEATGKRLFKKRHRKIDISPSDSEAIRRIMHRFYRENQPVNLKQINEEVKKWTDLRVCSSTLWHIFGQIGFRYQNRISRLHVYEKPEIMQKRDNYIREITKFRGENRKIYYQDETWINAGYVAKKGWIDTNIEKDLRDIIHPSSSLTLGYKDPSGSSSNFDILEC
uniref:Transposase n=1 Tax=Romanomermis culicivorax TaxID=13658 RepID=A0A915KZ55_ROMCU